MEQEDNSGGMDDKKTKSSDKLTESQTEAPSEPKETPAEVRSSERTENSAEVLDKPAELPTEGSKLMKPLAEAFGDLKDEIPSNVYDKPESSEKKTPKSLKAKSNIVKKSVAVNGLNNNKNKGKAQAQWKKKKNNKKVLQRNKESGGSDQGVKKQISDKENKSDQAERNEEGFNESEKSQQKLEEGEKSGMEKENQDEMIVNDEHTEKSRQVQKNKEKISESEKSQEKLKKGKRRGGSARNIKNRKSKEKDPEAKDSGENKRSSTVKKKEKVDGLIFMCSGKTKPDCFRYRVMGVSIGKKDTVMGIKRGMKLFLYDFDLKLLYGIYKATATGGVKLEPKAFNGAFPAQVRFEVHKDCLPLPESVFKKAIKENYNEHKKFKTELTSAQVKKLMSLFRPTEIHSSVTIRPPLVAPTARKVERESHSLSARKGESDSSREKKARDSSRNGDSRTHRPRSRERDHNRGHREARREASPRNLYLSEKEYRTYGLRGERRNLSPPPRIHDPPPETYRRDYERDQLSRHSNVFLGDSVPLRRETGVLDPLYPSDRDYHDAYSLGDRRELLSFAPSATALNHYAKDSYYSRYSGGSTVDSYLPPPRRENILSDSSYSVGGRRESYMLEADRRGDIDRLDRLYSTYAPDALPSYHRTYHTARHDATHLPASSRYLDAPSYYR